MNLVATEGKSTGQLNPFNHSVRVFVNNDYSYGYFVNEHQLFDLLSPAQQAQYLQEGTAHLEVEPAVAQQIIDMGQTIYTTKPRVI